MKRAVFVVVFAILSASDAVALEFPDNLTEEQAESLVSAVTMKGFKCEKPVKVAHCAFFAPEFCVFCEGDSAYIVKLVETGYGVKPAVTRAR